MIKLLKYLKLLSAAICLIPLLQACDPKEDIDDPDENFRTGFYGSVNIEFPIEDIHLPHRCIKRSDLSIAYTADSLYRKEYVTVANVSDYQSLYKFSLEPGSYYYQAAKTCICGGDTCLWGGYPGGQNGMIYTMAKFDVSIGKISYDKITFD